MASTYWSKRLSNFSFLNRLVNSVTWIINDLRIIQANFESRHDWNFRPYRFKIIIRIISLIRLIIIRNGRIHRWTTHSCKKFINNFYLGWWINLNISVKKKKKREIIWKILPAIHIIKKDIKLFSKRSIPFHRVSFFKYRKFDYLIMYLVLNIILLLFLV